MQRGRPSLPVIVAGLAVALAILVGPAAAHAKRVPIPSTMIWTTLQQQTICTARTVIQYPIVPGAISYEVVYYHVASGSRAITHNAPPFNHRSLGHEAPEGFLWTELTGNAGLTCALAVQYSMDDWRDPEVTALLADFDLEPKLAIDPPELGVGAKFTATLTVRNPTGNAFTDVQPTANPVVEGDGEVKLLEGPTPASVATLAVGETTTFTWKYEATVAGTGVLKVQVQGRNVGGSVLTFDAACSLSGAQPLALRGAREATTCPIDGKGAVVKIAPCSIEIQTWVNEGVDSDDVTLTKLGADSLPEGEHDYPAGGT